MKTDSTVRRTKVSINTERIEKELSDAFTVAIVTLVMAAAIYYCGQHFKMKGLIILAYLFGGISLKAFLVLCSVSTSDLDTNNGEG